MKKHEKKYIEVEGIMRACFDSFAKTNNQAYKEIALLVEAVPASDVQEVRHGRWKQVGDNTYRCSVCGEISCCNSPFCSECGAKMDEVEE